MDPEDRDECVLKGLLLHFGRELAFTSPFDRPVLPVRAACLQRR